ncbi:DNA-binding GntR family transcriptional regulator [Kribbella antiqua]|uniref:DNA-binding GntR family transcriptional regulator n=1 Tax=Kribbella antiqua TaxID=2512217 RepID=A0A4R2IGP5_9ACTN|nr:GntR family transcriptional regulator [Kribbella antiqua]TCO44011.1 DNA-binding GntR family transcriptional regulator [Kribbella antiqua]
MAVTSDTHPLRVMATPVNRKLPLPAWAQVERDLRALIEQELEIGSQLPTEKEIAQIYDVSRITVRQALASLADEGYVERKQGAGTFVADRPRQVQHDFGLTTPWRDRFRQAGKDAESIHLTAAAVEDEPYELARALTPEEREMPRLHLKRLHVVNHKPIGVTDSWLAGASADALRGTTLVDGSVSKSLDEHGIFETTVDHILEVRSVNSVEAVLLEAANDSQVFLDWSISRSGPTLIQTSRTVWLGARVRFHYSSNLG